MKIFYNDIALDITHIQDMYQPELCEVYSKEDIKKPILHKKLAIRGKEKEILDEILNLLKNTIPEKDIRIAVKNYDRTIDYIKSKYLLIKAAGGVVYKKDKLLFIYRLGKWDFPKGKLEQGEDIRSAAVREVEEETHVKVKREKKIGVTWHVYEQSSLLVLKETHWFKMKCLDDALMQPQQEEGIEQLQWITESEAAGLLARSYRSIREVYQQYEYLIKT